jgi:putative ABC transport system substrate-binding protein
VVSGVAASALAGCDRSPSVPKARLPRLGVLIPGEPRRYVEAFEQGLIQQGLVPGSTIVMDVRASHGDPARAAALAAELVALRPDLIYAGIRAEALAAREAVARSGTPIPIVFSAMSDPVAEGLVPNLNHPDQGMTGLALPEAELETKRLAVFNQFIRTRADVAFLGDYAALPAYMSRATTLLEESCRTLGIRALFMRTDTRAELQRALADAAAKRVDAVEMIAMSPLILNERRLLIDFVTEHKIPTMYGDEIFVEDGGLMFYGPSFASMLRKSGEQIARILRGTPMADIPVERPNIYELCVNLEAAQAIGLAIPHNLLAQATRVVR